VQGGEIGVGVGTVDNGGTLITSFIGSYDDGRWTVKGREAMAVKF
jgi:hypothetical protein